VANKYRRVQFRRFRNLKPNSSPAPALWKIASVESAPLARCTPNPAALSFPPVPEPNTTNSPS
jgi:hypothetical protein